MKYRAIMKTLVEYNPTDAFPVISQSIHDVDSKNQARFKSELVRILVIFSSMKM
jgi:hypothetical protein